MKLKELHATYRAKHSAKYIALYDILLEQADVILEDFDWIEFEQNGDMTIFYPLFSNVGWTSEEVANMIKYIVDHFDDIMVQYRKENKVRKITNGWEPSKCN